MAERVDDLRRATFAVDVMRARPVVPARAAAFPSRSTSVSRSPPSPNNVRQRTFHTERKPESPLRRRKLGKRALRTRSSTHPVAKGKEPSSGPVRVRSGAEVKTDVHGSRARLDELTPATGIGAPGMGIAPKELFAAGDTRGKVVSHFVMIVGVALAFGAQ